MTNGKKFDLLAQVDRYCCTDMDEIYKTAHDRRDYKNATDLYETYNNGIIDLLHALSGGVKAVMDRSGPFSILLHKFFGPNHCIWQYVNLF